MQQGTDDPDLSILAHGQGTAQAGTPCLGSCLVDADVHSLTLYVALSKLR